MSLKYNHFLLSTCLPIVAIVMFPHTSVYAGFEWTPPEKIESAPLPPVAPEVVMSEELDVVEENQVAGSNPEIFETISKEQIGLDDTVLEIDSENIIEEVSMELNHDVINKIDIEHEAEIIEEIGEEVIIESKDPSEFTLSPFPIENGEDSYMSENDEIIVLPSDAKTNLSDIVADDEISEHTQDNGKIIWENTSSFDVIEGFGTDMPLALALRQIVPANYAFSFGKGVNPGIYISWNGGNPWNEVLKNALSQQNITYKIGGNIIILNQVMVEDQAEMHHSAVTSVFENEKVIEVNKDETSTDELIEIIDNSETNLHVEATGDPSDIKQVEEINIHDPKIIEIIEIEEIAEEKVNPLIDKESSKREVIFDPGQSEAEQPIILESSEENYLLEEKKNEIAVADTIEIIDMNPILEKPNNIEEGNTSFRAGPSNMIKIWEAKRGSKLKDVLKEWSAVENIELQLNLSNNSKIDKDIFINGTFKNAISILFSKCLKNAPPYLLTKTPSYKLKVESII